MEAGRTPTGIPGLSSKTWLRTLWLALWRLSPHGLRRVPLDNGIGLAPNMSGLPQSARYALSLGESILYNPPAQRWRNGGLERFHWTMEREYWRDSDPGRMGSALAGLNDFLNYYNCHRGLTGSCDTGVVRWQPKKNLDVPVAQFRHTMDGLPPRPGAPWPPYHGQRHLEVDGDPPPDQGVDMAQRANQIGRVSNRRVDLADGARPVEGPIHEARTPGT